MASARARCSPTRRGRNQVLPPSGSRPMRAKACRNEADLPATAMSEASAKLMPTPAAGPFTAATIGLGTLRIRRITGLKNLSSASPESDVACLAIGIGEIGAGAEAAARAGQQHGAHGRVGGEFFPALLQLGDHLARHGVQPVRRIQGQRGEAICPWRSGSSRRSSVSSLSGEVGGRAWRGRPRRLP